MSAGSAAKGSKPDIVFILVDNLFSVSRRQLEYGPTPAKVGAASRTRYLPPGGSAPLPAEGVAD
jgi:hypothetical protein